MEPWVLMGRNQGRKEEEEEEELALRWLQCTYLNMQEVEYRVKPLCLIGAYAWDLPQVLRILEVGCPLALHVIDVPHQPLLTRLLSYVGTRYNYPQNPCTLVTDEVW